LLPIFLFISLISPSSCAADQAQIALKTAEELNLANDPTWKALLHYARERCFVTDPKYYLSPVECSLASELESLIEGIYSKDKNITGDISCRFPARIKFIKERLSSKGVAVPNLFCPDFVDYQEHAPAERISLVFAAENITHPMSMMGHVFLKFNGRSKTGEDLEHAASFFTRFSSVNIPATILEALYFGMPAFFALMPYDEQIQSYRSREGRNLFEYPIIASEYQTELIHAHVWELRTIKSPYLFVGYNCATVVYFLMSLANPMLLDELGLWISPIDVVRYSKKHKVIDSRTFLPSLDWQTRFFAQQIGPTAADKIIQTLQGQDAREIQELAKSTNNSVNRSFVEALIQREKLNPQYLKDNINKVEEAFLADRSKEPAELEVENLKDPTTGPKSSRVTFGATRFDNQNYAKLELVPASHSLTDDNTRSYSESALEIGSISLLFNPDENRDLVLEKLNIYGMQSLVPYDRYIGGISSRFAIGIQQEWTKYLEPYTAGHITLGLGQTLQASADANFYGLINVAASYGDGRGMLSYFPEVGLTLYEIFSMKTVANYRLMCGQHGDTGCYQEAHATQSLLWSDEFSPYLGFSNIWNKQGSSQKYELGLKFYF